jgi:hypothetical protein
MVFLDTQIIQGPVSVPGLVRQQIVQDYFKATLSSLRLVKGSNFGFLDVVSGIQAFHRLRF